MSSQGANLDKMVGGRRIIIEKGTTEHAGKFYAIEVDVDAVIATLTPAEDYTITGTITGVTWPAGKMIYGIYTNIKLTSGEVTIYGER